jgi:uncharacterized protein (DUF2147 family)
MKYTLITIVAAVAVTCTSAWGQDDTPLGLWKSIDEHTNKPTALIRITEADGKLQGRVETVFVQPGESANPICEECEGDLKNQPVIGMIILKGLRLVGGEYTEGRILDPDSGVVYRCTMKILEGGNKLLIRGFVGIPLLGRSQVWLRDH